MQPHHRLAEDRDDRSGDSLEAGLRAAFGGGDSDYSGGATSVVDTLARTRGVASNILLRDVTGEQTPMVRPLRPEGGTAPAAGGRYQIVGEIARGGVGVILKSRDVDLGRDIAMKVLREPHKDDAVMVQRFVEEAQISGQLQHPGILPIYELGLRSDGAPYFTMKLVKGQTLAALLSRRADAAADRQHFVSIFHQVCQTVAYVHAKGVIHRDLKPANIMVGSFGEVQVVDWGLAKVLGQSPEDSSRASAAESLIATVRSGSRDNDSLAGSVMGTPAYMPPEQARGEVSSLDERADVFALGAMLCEVLTGRPPYVGEKADVLRAAARADLGDALSRLDRCGADEALVALAKLCLSPAREGRPGSAGDVAAAVTSYVESLEARARTFEIAAAEAAAKARGERRARRLTMALATTISLTIAAAAGASLWAARAQAARIAQGTNDLNEALGRAALDLGRARAARPGLTEPWNEVMASARHIEQILRTSEVDAAGRQRAEAFLADLTRVNADRTLMQRIEDVVVVGATHEDRASWEWMSRQLRAAFREYGVDLETLTNEEIGARLQASALAPQLTDGVELWIATEFHLRGQGGKNFTLQQLLQRVEALYLADPDPFRVRLRKLIYTGRPDLNQVRELAGSPDFEKQLPRTMAWLAAAYAMSGDHDSSYAVFERALRIYPDDFMLTFDFAYMLAPQKRWEEAIRYYHRALVLRPQNGGVWRALGIALREKGETLEAIKALETSIRFQPDHAPTYVDLGLARRAARQFELATEAFERAVALQPELARAHCELAEALRQAGREEEAQAADEECQRLSPPRRPASAPTPTTGAGQVE